MKSYSIQHTIDDLLIFIKRFVYLENDNDYLIVALFILATYCPETFNTFPYLFINGPHGAGKTTLLELIEALGSKVVFASQITCAAIYHVLHEEMATILFDEAEYLTGDYLRIVRAGYKRSGYVITVHKNREGIIRYSVRGLKVIARIKGINDQALLSRCIKILMTISTKNLEYFCLDMHQQEVGVVKSKIEALFADNNTKQLIRRNYYEFIKQQ